MGYRMAVGGEVLNVLRWTTDGRDARRRIVPGELQPHARLRRAAAAGAHPSGVRRRPASRSPTSTRCASPATAPSAPSPPRSVRLARAGEPLRVRVLRGARQGAPRVRPRRAVRRGAALDRPPRRPRCSRSLPAGTALVVTADHGQVETGDDVRRAAERRAHPRGHAVAARAGSAGCTRGRAGPRALARGGRGAARRPRVGAHPGAGHRRGLVRPEGHRRGRRPPR